MKKVIVGVIALAAFGMSAAAQQPLAGDALKAFVSGKSLDYGSDGTATYKADGKYEYYNKGNGQTARGAWNVRDDRLCVDFNDGQKRCDQLIRDANNKVLLKNARGQTFPVTAK